MHVIKPGVVALQNLHDQGRYLRASEEELGFSGGAHVNQHLRVKEVGERWSVCVCVCVCACMDGDCVNGLWSLLGFFLEEI